MLKKCIPYFLVTQLIPPFLHAGDLLEGLEETSSNLITRFTPILAVLGCVLAGIYFIIGEGETAKRKATNTLIGAGLVFTSPWIIDFIQSIFGR